MTDFDDGYSLCGNSEALNCTYTVSGDLKKGDHVVLDSCPAKIVELKHIKDGKHGHAKTSIVAIDIFSGKKHKLIVPGSSRVLVPEVEKKEFQVIDIDEGKRLSLMDAEYNKRDDIMIEDDELGNSIREAFAEEAEIEVTILSALGLEKVYSMRRYK